jgi:magnesium chelatase family protein
MHYFKIESAAILGTDLVPVNIECVQARRLPFVQILGGSAHFASETRERVLAALESSGFRLPARKITVHLHPGVHGSTPEGLDLAIALAIAGACGRIPPGRLREVFVSGSLGLDGQIYGSGRRAFLRRYLRARGEPPAILAWDESDILEDRQRQNGGGFRNLAELLAFLRGEGAVPSPPPPRESRATADAEEAWESIPGLPVLKRALMLVAAGGHHLMLLGQDEARARSLARGLHSLLPPLAPLEEEEVASVRAAAGDFTAEGRPFVEFGHTRFASGRGRSSRGLAPWVLAGHGVLFVPNLRRCRAQDLAELRSTLTAGRIGGESGSPSAVPLLCGSLPVCPCGNLGSASPCICSPRELERHRSWGRQFFGGVADLWMPLWERKEPQETSPRWSEARAKVEAMRHRWRERQKTGNGALSEADLFRAKDWDSGSRTLWRKIRLGDAAGTARSLSVARIALTLSDLRAAGPVTEEDILEAQFFAGAGTLP